MEFRIPNNLDFRLEKLRNEESQILLDIELHGSEMFSEFIIQLEDKDKIRQNVELIS